MITNRDSRECHVLSFHVTLSDLDLSDLAQYSVIPSIARPLCDSWTSCSTCWLAHCKSAIVLFQVCKVFFVQLFLYLHCLYVFSCTLIAFYRASAHWRDIDIAILSVRPSVRPSHAGNENGLTYCYSFFTTRYPNHSSFMGIKQIREIPTGSPPVGALNTGGV